MRGGRRTHVTRRETTVSCARVPGRGEDVRRLRSGPRARVAAVKVYADIKAREAAVA